MMLPAPVMSWSGPLEAAFTGILVSALKSVLLFAAAFALALAMRAAGPRLRHAAWCTAMIGALALPVVTVVAPAWPLRLLATPAFHSMSAVVDPVPEPAAIDPENFDVPSSGRTMILSSRKAATRISPVAAGAVVWILGAAAVLFYVLVGFLRAEFLAAKGRRVSGHSWMGLVAECARRSGIKGPVRVRFARISGPAAWGVFRATILIPEAAEDWPIERWRVMLLHEMMHIRRGDWAGQILSRVACAVYWFNPVVWAAERRLALEREQACDDAVIALEGHASEYAGHLLEIAGSLSTRYRDLPAAVHMVRKSRLEVRIMTILNRPMNRRSRIAAGIPVLLALLVPPLAMLSPWGRSEAGPFHLGPANRPPRAGTSSGFSGSTSTTVDDGHKTSTRYGIEDGSFVYSRSQDEPLNLFMRVRGEVEFDSGGAIKSLEPDGSIQLESDEGKQLQLMIRNGEAGGFDYDWRIDGRVSPFDEAARLWMRAALEVLAAEMETALIQGQVNSLQGDINSIHGERNSLQGDINSFHGDINSLQGEINSLHGERNSAQGEINSIYGERNSLEGEINSLSADLDRARRIWRDLQADDEPDADRIRSLESRIESLTAGIREAHETIAVMRIDERVRKINNDLARRNLGEREQELRAEIQALENSGREEEIRAQIEALDVDRRVMELQRRIEEIHADEKLAPLRRKLRESYDRLESETELLSK